MWRIFNSVCQESRYDPLRPFRNSSPTADGEVDGETEDEDEPRRGGSFAECEGAVLVQLLSLASFEHSPLGGVFDDNITGDRNHDSRVATHFHEITQRMI